MAATALSRPVPTDFWIRPDVNEEYTLDDKLLYVYLITNQHFQQLGIYKLTKRMMSVELGMDLDRLNASFERLQNKFKAVKYSDKTSEVAILDYYKFGILKGGKPFESCFDNLGKKVEDLSLLKDIYMASKSIIDDRDAFDFAIGKIEKFLDSKDMFVANEGNGDEAQTVNDEKPVCEDDEDDEDDDELPF